MATIKIERTSEFINYFRDYKIWIDGQEVGTIANGKTKTFDTGPGQHTIQAKIDWCSSPALATTIKDGADTTLKVGGFKYSNWFMTFWIAFIILHYVLDWKFDLPFRLSLITLPFLLTMIGLVTIARNRYLSIEEI